MQSLDARFPRAATFAGAFAFAFVLTLAASLARADEGMWTLDDLPLQGLQERYGFAPPPGWVEHVQRSAVKFPGGSGGFVSPEGLVITNHHVVRATLQRLSSPERDLLRDGFVARTRAEELRIPAMELMVLRSIEDVTAEVQAAVDAKAPDSVQSAQRRASVARIEQRSKRATGLHSTVVELYRGARHALYRYERHEDVRLVFAPEERFGSFGGDWDNYTYPRHDLDVAFLRIYENGRPLRTPHWYGWSLTGVQEGDLVFSFGHPGTTSRLKTVAQLEFDRDVELPARIRMNELRRKAYYDHAALGSEQKRQVKDRISSVENLLKRYRGYLETLEDAGVMERKRADEAALRGRIEADPALAREAGGAWERIAAAQTEMRALFDAWLYRPMSGAGRLHEIATGLVRHAYEIQRPAGERLEEFRESALAGFRLRLMAPTPVYPALEEHTLAFTLQECLDRLGPDDPFVRAALGGREPAAVARELVRGTKVGDLAVRRGLLEGGRRAIEASKDPFVVWARRVEPAAREAREAVERRVRAIEAREGGRLGRARFALSGPSQYPDATGTLRLSFGRVAGFEEGTTLVPWHTNFYTLFGRAAQFGGQEPFDLPASVEAARGRIDLTTPLNLIATLESIGGSSGSPVVDREARLVGVVFDSNIPGLQNAYVHDERRGRCVVVDARGILESLRKVYGLEALADELVRGSRGR
jgi:hypothetical protein